MAHDPVEEIFLSALERPADERDAFVAAACAGSPELRAEVDSLLAGYASRRFPEEMDAGAAAALLEESAATGVEGWRIGPYRVLREIGRGGMGTVYLAERADGAFERQVALKLIKRGMDSEAILGRFFRERQILARLEHPNIAHLLDGGLTDDGLPYLVMEHVAGRPLMAYCGEEGIGVDGRLDLFAEVCRAVQHAHRNLVIHRDLKPSNVLVTDRGRVKLLDFGIAKLLDENGDARATPLTRQGAEALTPQYAAPEQVRGEPATTATDVYALGLMLYELLTGETPYAVDKADAAHAICNTDPLPPSRSVAEADPGSRRLRRRLRGDLDTIVLKALRKEPERRYASAEALLEDLRRHHSGLPVKARPETLGYLASRFIKRHVVVVVASAMVVLSLVGGLGAALWQVRVATAERDATRLEARKLAAAQAYLVSLFEAAEPAEARGEEITARQLVDRGIERLQAELAEQPKVQLEMYRVLADVAYELGEYDRVETLLNRALPRARRHYGKDGVKTANLLTLRGKLLHARGEWEAAEGVLRRALAIYRRRGAGEGTGAMEALGMLGSALHTQGKENAAEAAHRRALALARRTHGGRSPQVSSALNNLAIVLKERGALDAAEAALRESLDIDLELYGDDHPHVATTMINLAGVLFNRGDLLAAEPYYRRGVALERKLRGEDHPRYAVKLHNLANLLHTAGRYDEAASLHRQVLATLRVRFGDEHPYTGAALDSLADDLAAAGRLDEAVPLFEHAARVLRDTVGTDHELYAIHRFRLGAALREQGETERSVALLDESVELFRRIKDGDHKLIALALGERGRAHLARGDVERSERDLRAALRIQRRALAAPHPATAMTLTHLARTLLARGRPEQAASSAREGLRMAEATLPAEHEVHAEARAILAAAGAHLQAGGSAAP